MSGSFQQRGGTWVIAQFMLMGCMLAVPPLARPGEWNWLALAGGAMLMLLGAWVGIRGTRDLGKSRTPFPQPLGNSTLVTSGIYARIRHPLYSSLILLGFGWTLAWVSLSGLVVACSLTAFLLAKARCEETQLAEKFPDYTGYATRVKGFVPGVF